MVVVIIVAALVAVGTSWLYNRLCGRFNFVICQVDLPLPPWLADDKDIKKPLVPPKVTSYSFRFEGVLDGRGLDDESITFPAGEGPQQLFARGDPVTVDLTLTWRVYDASDPSFPAWIAIEREDGSHFNLDIEEGAGRLDNGRYTYGRRGRSNDDRQLGEYPPFALSRRQHFLLGGLHQR